MIRSDEMVDRYKDGALLRRWSLVAGWPRCVLAPLEVARVPAAEVEAIEAANAELRALVAAVEAYEAALLLLDGAEPPAVFPDAEGEPAPSPARAAWDAALEVVADATPATVTLAQQRAQPPRGPARILALEEHYMVVDLFVTDDPNAEGVEVSPEARIGGSLPDGLVPLLPVVPDEVTNFQARAVMRQTILPDDRSLETAVRETLWNAKQAAASLPESHPDRMAADAAWLAWEQSNTFARRGRLVTNMAPTFGLTDEQVGAMFVAAAMVEA